MKTWLKTDIPRQFLTNGKIELQIFHSKLNFSFFDLHHNHISIIPYIHLDRATNPVEPLRKEKASRHWICLNEQCRESYKDHNSSYKFLGYTIITMRVCK